ncbi:hypothetical protein Vqi01_22310 [Micromonospora qiuiae]|uniref:DUF4082 domain-containing protein n=1 Tax=Micromonospora qiuiae TaxID=502268 RepID=A0ABQ4JAA7_9ACTN|nr:DUF4082 domain-containing protein [Micromonospora qiuiae]GIJ27069.1 hypothetical protein Vqi01_22310 [Micromonospora qiuiae]
MTATVAAALVIVLTSALGAWGRAAVTTTYSFFADLDVSRVPTDPDFVPVEVGLRFTSSRDGTLTAVRFLKAEGSGNTHPVSVWTAGRRLATATSTNETSSGWQEVRLPTPVTIKAGEVYVVSYHTTRYRVSENYFTAKASSGPLTTTSDAGVYAYGESSFPTETYRASNYWVDVVFAPAPVAPTTPPTTPTTTTPSVTSPPPTGAPTASPPVRPALNLPRVAWEGGPSYYASFPVANAAGWTNHNFFPIGVWYESVLTQHDVDLDRTAGLNTYVMLTSNSDLSLVRRNGMFAVVDTDVPGQGAETTAWWLNDEVDMWAGPGASAWTGNYPGEGQICVGGKLDCGFEVLRRLSAELPTGDGRMRYANFGKGVMFWETDSDSSRFVNGYTSLFSSDIYWYTDPNVCLSSSEGPSIGVTASTCRRAANYGLTMQRMRQVDGLDGKRQPIWAFVELGHPASEDSAPTITAPQIAGAVMNSLINEARGIIYFNHNFGGPCITQHVLRDACGAAVRPTVTELNKRIIGLAPVLNTQSYAWTFNRRLDTMLKEYAGSYYLFAMPGRTGGTGTQGLTLPPGLTANQAQVLFENRTVPISGGMITDNFASEHSYHIYKIIPTA